jgi:hypothetical protein
MRIAHGATDSPSSRATVRGRTEIVGALPRLSITRPAISGLHLIIDCVDLCSVQHCCVRFPIGAVTAASGSFESAAVQYVYFTAMIFY